MTAPLELRGAIAVELCQQRTGLSTSAVEALFKCEPTACERYRGNADAILALISSALVEGQQAGEELVEAKRRIGIQERELDTAARVSESARLLFEENRRAAKLVARLEEERDAAREALQGLHDLIEDKVLVRNISEDHDVMKYARQAMRIVGVLKKTQEVLGPVKESSGG